MKTTITIVDPLKGTLVVETEGKAEVRLDGNSTSVVVDGAEIDPGSELLTAKPPAPVVYRTPDPSDQTLSVKTDDGKELPQGQAAHAPDELCGSYEMKFIWESKTTIKGECISCGTPVSLRKKDYSTEQLTSIKSSMIDYPPENAPVAPVRDETPKKGPEPSPGPETAAKQPKKAPEEHVTIEKTCQNCGDPFTVTGKAAGPRKFCDTCKKIPGYKRKGAGRPEFQSPEPTGPNGEQPEGKWWCIYHKDWQEHRSPECPIIDEDKSPAERAAAATEAAGIGDDFTDPWNCGRCREERHLCRLHRSMEASGTKPPKIRPS